MAHVFISYKREDKPEFIAALKHNLGLRGFEVNIDTDILSGEKWSDQIEIMIKKSFAVILVLTTRAMTSQWVNFEWAFALGSGAKVIVIKLDKSLEIPEQLKAIQNLDFCDTENWENLINDLDQQHAKTWKKYWIPSETPRLIKCALEGLMETDDASELDAFVNLLTKHRNKYSVTALINGLKSPDHIVRAKAAWALGPIRDAEAVESLIVALDENSKPVVIAHVVGALGNIGDKRAVPRLSNLLEDRSVFSSLTRQPYRQDTISNQALIALNLIGAPEALAAVEAWKREQEGK